MSNEVISSADVSKLPVESMVVNLARAEVDQQVSTAKAYPRSVARVIQNILTMATLDETTAAECLYAVPRDKKMITGPSVRLAEIVSINWGNCRIGARVVHVDRFEKYLEAEGMFHDLETNMATVARVRRRISNSSGRIYSEDMIVITGNAACAIAKRNAILGAVPRGVWRKAYDAVEAVIKGDAKTLEVRRRNAIKTLTSEYKITERQIFDALDVSGEADIGLDQVATLSALRAGLKNGETTVDDVFPKHDATQAAPRGLTERLDAIAAVDPPHDPETGEVLNEETDPTGEKSGARLKGMLDERADAAAAGETGPGEVNGALALGALMEQAQRVAKEGSVAFKKWSDRLNAPDYALIESHLDSYAQRAAYADEERKKKGE